MDQFDIEILPDGKVKMVSAGGFSQEKHKSADELLAHVKDLVGGEVETTNLKKGHGNPHAHGHDHGHQHHHH